MNQDQKTINENKKILHRGISFPVSREAVTARIIIIETKYNLICNLVFKIF